MTTQRDSLLGEVRSVRAEVDRLMEGIDYCFDWKADEGEWSAREIVYHLVDTPSGGIHSTVQGVLDGSMEALHIAANLTNLTQERRDKDVTAARGDLEEILTGMKGTLASATDDQLSQKRVPVHSTLRPTVEERTAQQLVEGIFLRHWREHLAQLAALREALGLD